MSDMIPNGMFGVRGLRLRKDIGPFVGNFAGPKSIVAKKMFFGVIEELLEYSLRQNQIIFREILLKFGTQCCPNVWFQKTTFAFLAYIPIADICGHNF